MFLESIQQRKDFPAVRTHNFIKSVDDKLTNNEIPEQIVPHVLWILEGMYKGYIQLSHIATIKNNDVFHTLMDTYHNIIEKESEETKVHQPELLEKALNSYKEDVQTLRQITNMIENELKDPSHSFSEIEQDILLSFCLFDAREENTFDFDTTDFIASKKSMLKMVERFAHFSFTEEEIVELLNVSYEQMQIGKKYFPYEDEEKNE